MRPWALRPPVLRSGSSSERSGVVLVISSNVGTVANRCPGVCGLNFFSPMCFGLPSRCASPATLAQRSPARAVRHAFAGALGQRLQVNLLSGGQRDHGLLVAFNVDGVLAAPPLSTGNPNRVDLGNPHTKQLLHRVADRWLRRVPGHFKRVLASLVPPGALIGEDGPTDDGARIGHRPNTSTTASTAGVVNTTASAARRSYTVTPAAGRTTTCGRLAADRTSMASGAAVTTSVFPLTGRCASSATTAFVLGASRVGGSTITIAPAAAFADSTDRTANCRIFWGVCCRYSRGWGPNAMPPPTKRGAFRLPCRARPVPFCRQILRVLPDTSPRVLVACVPVRRLAI